ncbi:putative AAA-ATPase [Thiorhodovibrio litoralis]|nr:putative AAA-ATPase [Thiorhodovibrio litoralis]
MSRKKLPIGVQTFAKMREDDYYYVDKTGFALRLIDEGSHYFLSRPRRFGKSLFLDTLAELFSGNRELFNGLVAENQWDWSRRHPVIRLSFGGGVLHSRAKLEEKIDELLTDNLERLGVSATHRSPSGRLQQLIKSAGTACGEKVVVLVDEYDKPILDNLGDKETARAMRDGLRDLYSVIKDSDAHLRFVFLTHTITHNYP